MFSLFILDCNDPNKTGYQLGNPSTTTYGGIVSVNLCDTGYIGTPSVNKIACEADGSWSDVSGCNIVSKYSLFLAPGCVAQSVGHLTRKS